MTTDHHEQILDRLDRVIELLEDIRAARQDKTFTELKQAVLDRPATGGVILDHAGQSALDAYADCVPARLSPGESMIAGPNGLLHIRGAYGDEPAQVTEIDIDDLNDERTEEASLD